MEKSPLPPRKSRRVRRETLLPSHQNDLTFFPEGKDTFSFPNERERKDEGALFHP